MFILSRIKCACMYSALNNQSLQYLHTGVVSRLKIDNQTVTMHKVGVSWLVVQYGYETESILQIKFSGMIV